MSTEPVLSPEERAEVRDLVRSMDPLTDAQLDALTDTLLQLRLARTLDRAGGAS